MLPLVKALACRSDAAAAPDSLRSMRTGASALPGAWPTPGDGSGGSGAPAIAERWATRAERRGRMGGMTVAAAAARLLADAARGPAAARGAPDVEEMRVATGDAAGGAVAAGIVALGVVEPGVGPESAAGALPSGAACEG